MGTHDENHAVIQLLCIFKAGVNQNRSITEFRPHVVVEFPGVFEEVQVSLFRHLGQPPAVAKVRKQSIQQLAFGHTQVFPDILQDGALHHHKSAVNNPVPKGLDESLPLFVVLSQVYSHSNTSIWWFHQMEEAERHELDIHHVNRLKT